jgi:hypothetical protein
VLSKVPVEKVFNPYNNQKEKSALNLSLEKGMKITLTASEKPVRIEVYDD